MLKLGGPILELRNVDRRAQKSIVRLTDRPDRPRPLREREAFWCTEASLPDGFSLYLVRESLAKRVGELYRESPVAVVGDDFSYLTTGDIVRIWPARLSMRVLYRRNSAYNSILTTERCNNYCLMCSQPPKRADDSWIVGEVLETIRLMDPATAEIGLTGGEPTLLGEDFLRIVDSARGFLPNTALHVLSNGRRFSDPMFAEQLGAIGHPDLMIGVPVYSDLSHLHDYVVQADGAFDETIRGIINLKRFGVRVEIRVVVHRQTYRRLPELAAFLCRNLTFADHIALMGLEMTGFTLANLDALWIDPIDYQPELRAATLQLADFGMPVSIFNHQLCLLDRELWPFARRSISDWKNEYMPECEPCTERTACGGFFSSAAVRRSDHIRAIA